MRVDLTKLLDHTVWFPAHQTLGRTWETRAEAAMANIGYPTLLRWYNENTKLSLVAEKTELTAGANTQLSKFATSKDPTANQPDI